MTKPHWIEIYETVKHLPMEQRESAFRSAWLESHQGASSMVFDEKTGVPHQAIYEYPASTITGKEILKAFFAAVQLAKLKREATDAD